MSLKKEVRNLINEMKNERQKERGRGKGNKEKGLQKSCLLKSAKVCLH